jgi:alpha-beta hydrolase superfamily lysophospholipase/thiol-disulfide isomerase/thioredoxin
MGGRDARDLGGIQQMSKSNPHKTSLSMGLSAFCIASTLSMPMMPPVQAEIEQKQKAPTFAPCVSWVKLGVSERAILLCVHGLGLNSSSFEKFGNNISELGIGTYAIDVEGFGSWMRLKGHQKVDFKSCIAELKKTLEWLHQAHPHRPVFLMGESMGGAIALHAAAEYPELMDGVISVCSSGDRFKQKRTDLTVFLHAMLGPNRKFDIGEKIVKQAASDDTELKQQWEGDPLDRMSLSPVELLHFQHFMNENHDSADKITKLPVLMVQGTKDKLVKPEGTEEIFNELKTPDKQLLLVEDAGHLIFEEGQFNADSLSDLANWIFKHCPVPQPADRVAVALEQARESVSRGNLNAAAIQLRSAIAAAPNGAMAHLMMGSVQLKLQHYFLARQHLMQAARLGKGTAVSQQANNLLLTMPQGNGTAMRGGGMQQQRQSMTPPTVLVFTANWCKPCEDMLDVVYQAKQKFANRVVFKTIDVDDAQNADIVDQYSIGPVPTTVFLLPNGRIAASQVGYAGMDGMLKGLRKILPIQ